MLRLQGTGRIQSISGKCIDGSIEVVKDIVCPRKHVIDESGWVKIRKYKKVFAFISSPKIYTQPEMLQRVKAWCHPFRFPEKYLPSNVPHILLPESDFIDSSTISCKCKRKIEYDYFYFTVNAKPGIENKGLYTFFEILPILCYKNLKGIIIVYYPNSGNIKKFTIKMSESHRNNVRNASKYLTYHWGILRDSKMDEIMSKCRFGLFPNTVDNSPRIIAESLSRDVPILVNEKIHGGWHYVNQKTGSLFNLNNIEEKIDFMLSNKFEAKKEYESNFGFSTSSRRLAGFLNPIFGYNYTHMSFSAFGKMLKVAQ